ncbi:structural maintenance of chromosomes protein 2-like [Mya arenaria]|uniref:structural maintenance of chromosomes protein 2-like n=1 Tax=Mya arenaria TaxID=6604 RepID=UPI0022DFB03A|nr:structural maintenance of chromosomes protein 2-like [Mya arenaria]XP_052768560.1 structural maintenance of chromosomes protein 2-like [Mya arenaria]XP_052768561.1 structural maintenance of chromosomes protein 2-like [Mya arenaria]XP_052768562.1 structural maintenance of chromosomes protein 2-like [Mya arenaria]
MASKQIQCEMCSNEIAVGYCQTCGYVGEKCVNIHKTGKMFQTHTVIMHEANKKHTDSSGNPNVKLWDITEERCKQHPTEKAIFLCNIHDSMICGRCLHSEHIPCAKEVVDLLHEVVNIDCEKVNTMKSLLMEVKDEIMILKDEAEHCKEIYTKNADKCVQKSKELGNKLKERVDELTRSIRDGITEKHNENLTTHSHITTMCDEKTKWCHDEESKIDDFVDNNMAGHLYLMSRHFEKEVSDARSHLKEIKYKHTFKGFDFKENNVILKCVFEDLEEVCEQQEEVTGSDDGTANDVVASLAKINKTRRELTALLNQLKQDLDQSEKARNVLCDELKQVKQDKDNSEKKRRISEQELEKAKQDIDEFEKTRNALCDDLKQVKKDKDNSEKKKMILEQEVQKAKQDIEELKKTMNACCDELKQVKQDKDKSEKKRKILEQ